MSVCSPSRATTRQVLAARRRHFNKRKAEVLKRFPVEKREGKCGSCQHITTETKLEKPCYLEKELTVKEHNYTYEGGVYYDKHECTKNPDWISIGRDSACWQHWCGEYLDVSKTVENDVVKQAEKVIKEKKDANHSNDNRGDSVGGS